MKRNREFPGNPQVVFLYMKRFIPVLGLIPNTEINRRLWEEETRFAAIAAKMLIESLTNYCIYKISF